MVAPFFSIILPTYNREKLIQETVESILSQDFRDFELIIVDDGSTDNTKAVIGNFNDARILYFFQENKERGAARNKGVSLAKGQYITFFDADDFMYQSHLSSAYKFINKTGAKLFVNGYELVDDNRNVLQQINRITAPSPYLQLIYNNTLSIVLFFKRELAVKVSFSENRNFIIGEDLLYLLQAGSLAAIDYNSEITFGVRVHAQRTMAGVKPEIMLSSLYIFKRKFLEDRILTSNLGPSLSKRLLAGLYMNCAVHLSSFLKFKPRSICLILQSFRYRPMMLRDSRWLVFCRNLVLRYL